MVFSRVKLAFVALFAFLSIVFWISLIPRIYSVWTHKNVEIVYAYDAIEKLSRLSGKPVDELLKDFQDLGVSAYALKEDTLRMLADEGKVTVIKGSELLNLSRIQPRTTNGVLARFFKDSSVFPEALYLAVDDTSLMDFLRTSIENRLGKTRVKRVGEGLLEVYALDTDLLDLPLDINLDKLEHLVEKGFMVMPVFTNQQHFTEAEVVDKLGRLADYDWHTVLFSGDEFLGYPDQMLPAVQKLEDMKRLFGVVELTPQPMAGSRFYGEHLGNRSLKVHAIEMFKPKAWSYILQACRAVTERNCRILYIEPFVGFGQTDLVKYNAKIIHDLREELENRGYKVQSVAENPLNEQPQDLVKVIAYIGVLLMLVVFVSVYFPAISNRWKMVGCALYVVAGASLLYFNKISYFDEMLALSTTVVVPSLIYTFVYDVVQQNKKSMVPTLIQVLLTVFFATLGAAAWIHVLLQDPAYASSLTVFRGVKFASLLPLMFIAFYIMVKPERLYYIGYVLRRWFGRPITIVIMLLILILVGILLFYIMRTGNYGLMLGQHEYHMREWLEQLFIIRPRTKEILFGYPLLVFIVMNYHSKIISQNWKNGLFILSSIAAISMLNTFCHLHTPILISVYRSALGLVLGVIVGIVASVLWKMFEALHTPEPIHE